MRNSNRRTIVRALRHAAQALTADFASYPHFKDKWKRLKSSDVLKDKQLQEELFELVRTAYAPIGGHFKISRPTSLLDDEITFFDVLDWDDDPDADVVSLVKMTPHGEKHVGLGHDGQKASKDKVIRRKAEELRSSGVYTEVSDAMAHILITKFGIPSIDDEAAVRRVLRGKDIEWVGKHPEGKYPGTAGWYYRKIGGHRHMKIMLGRPKG